MRTPAQWFIRALAILDPLLRVREGSASSNWVIDRKAVLPVDELKYLTRREAGMWKQCQPENIPVDSPPGLIHQRRMKWMSVKEELESARDGRRIIFTTPELTQSVYDQLCNADISRYGGYARFADMIEAQEDAAQADRDRMMDNQRKAISGEVYDMLNFVNRKKGVLLDNNETDLRYMLHGERNQPGDKPLIELAEV